MATMLSFTRTTPLKLFQLAALSFAILGLPIAPAWSPAWSPAWAGDGKAADDKKQTPTEAAKDAAKKVDEIAEAGKLIPGPAGQPECVWTGRRIVALLWRDDLDTASRHRDLYERFGCPAPHIQSAFRCVVKQGELDAKAPESLNDRVHACWVNPQLEPSMPPPAVASDGTAPTPAPQ